jgi:NAD(P)-dependent dehydrogenase (short-subunit alcohol dehydrogenase family)
MSENALGTVLITGSSSGFGYLSAITLARAGFSVFATMRERNGRNRGVAEELEETSQKLQGCITCVELDVTDDDSVSAGVNTVLSKATSIDVLLNNAGLACAGFTESFSSADAHRLFDVNVYGPLRMARAVLPSMRRRGSGLIVYLSSTLGREVMPFLSLYGASKFALESIADGYRYELASLGIDSVIMQPGTFPTTQILANLIQPSDPSRQQEYGELAQIPDQIFQGIGELVASGNAPDPQTVVDEILNVIQTPAGSRPQRVVVDPNGPEPIERLNQASDQVQRELLEHLSLSHLQEVKTSR